ncbi:polyketide synthase [Umezawaea sp. Da 62-37]|uniref:beta-ketoacyl [acyl carrier protein] synthase domain-containing protein n=1 Tax=Umezawaea sp. Da 62-37 TaxID=3075927 RepID=UPI0028F70DCD|nr:polyketide synthase [Umezawaea sp. Da 62-37]WNV83978.1 polyketide synthase [Umezawaea sp. Da 62-37]
MTQPIAIVGTACRFPGARTPDQLWQLLLDGRDTIAPAPPAGRFDTTPVLDRHGRVMGLAGGYLDHEDFDPGLFAVTDREAAAMDPQHKVLLATARDALLDAGLTTRSPADVGVFMGQSTGEHWDSHRGPVDMHDIAGSAARSMASGRISHAWDLRGPCATVDAACSSGTLAVHLACQSLRTDECDTALAGGVSLVLGTDHTAGYAAAGLLSPTGRCHFGDKRADGFVRSDGAAVLVLKRLDRALADGDTVQGVILGSAQAGKGRTAKSVIAPSVEGYVQVITRACATAGITPSDLGYVEAHGNAAPAGDAVELQAIGATAGPCLVGSIKSTIGHPEAAGGLAGILKAALVLRHRTIPAGPRPLSPTSTVDWKGLGLTPVRTRTDWPGTGPAYAGVNTYGLSGTFVHVVLGEPPVHSGRT